MELIDLKLRQLLHLPEDIAHEVFIDEDLKAEGVVWELR